MTGLAGKTAIVTGASRGIGRAVVQELVAGGVRVVMNARDAEVLTAAASEFGTSAVSVAGSPSDAPTARSLVEAALDTFGRLDAVVNCAGIAEPHGSSILDIEVDAWEELIDAHLGTVFHTCRAAAPHLARQGHGSIVNTTSFAFLGNFGGTGYPAGKGAVNSLTWAIAAELKERGVRVNAVAPGARTRLSTGDEYVRQIEDLHARGLLDELTRDASLDPAPPEFVAPLYAYLVSDLSEGVTGQILAGSGCFIGRFDHPSSLSQPAVLAFDDHHSRGPWALEEIDSFIRR